jgi:hypothetical protein
VAGNYLHWVIRPGFDDIRAASRETKFKLTYLAIPILWRN